MFQSYFGVRLILSVITHFLLSSERSDLFPHLMCAFSPSPHFNLQSLKMAGMCVLKAEKERVAKSLELLNFLLKNVTEQVSA